MTCCLALAFVVALPPAAGRPAPRAAGDLGRLQGEWVVVAEERGGRRLTAGQRGFPQNLRVAFRGTTVRFYYPGRAAHTVATFRLDEKARPRRLRGTITVGQFGGPLLFVYVVKGDTLRIGHQPGVQGWPPALDAPAGSQRQVLVYRRVRR
jgi:uncharacterized protein (TIGR03067 family)